MDILETAILTDPTRATNDNLDVLLWRHAIHPPVDTLRKRLVSEAAKMDPETRKNQTYLLDRIILTSLGRLGYLITKLIRISDVNESENDDYDGLEERSGFLCRELDESLCKLLFRMSMNRGDLCKLPVIILFCA